MASEDAGKPPEHDPAESLIDDLIRDILTEAGQSTKARGRGGDPMTALIETAIASASRSPSATSTMERLLVTHAIANALADALAPALAEALAPEIMKALEHSPAHRGVNGEVPATTAAQPRGTRKKT
ncbi:hypothetical protein [Nonomuraea pusilla]|uniref:Uncharacterized protein n=1 Tax=Nonomuraea pusilla TaxID=46177 RepID=A0A1H8GSG1_9ACTN|nr:hypothetical protein [Nonomuraea pusilla]SEN46437.1 hypothetical protein SAMN05660976_07618 [Nonomuraea pusilla]